MEIISRKEAKAQGLKRYFTGKPCKYGHVAERRVIGGACVDCSRVSMMKHYEENKEGRVEARRKYNEDNKAKIAERERKYYEENKEKIAEYERKYRKDNKDKIAEKRRKYCEENKEKIAEWHRKRYGENPIPTFIRSSLNRILCNWKGGRAKQEAVHGYTYEDLTQHLESQFKDGMSWENRSEWHIDHIKPIKAFLDEGITDPAIINALDNLQPLWAHENRSKGAKYDQ